MEKKGLRVNAGKTKIMWCKMSKGQAEDSGEHPCGVCRKGFGDNSILCVKCLRWVHKRCSGNLKSNVDFHCRRCLEGEHGLFQSVLLKEVVIEHNVKLECVPKKANLQSLERTEVTEQMMVRWICGVSLKDRKSSVDLLSPGCTECGRCGEAWQIEVVSASGA